MSSFRSTRSTASSYDSRRISTIFQSIRQDRIVARVSSPTVRCAFATQVASTFSPRISVACERFLTRLTETSVRMAIFMVSCAITSLNIPISDSRWRCCSFSIERFIIVSLARMSGFNPILMNFLAKGRCNSSLNC